MSYIIFFFSAMPRRNCYTLDEAVSLLENDEDIDMNQQIDLVLIPPEGSGDVTDEENIDENNLSESTELPKDTAGTSEVHYTTVLKKKTGEKKSFVKWTKAVKADFDLSPSPNQDEKMKNLSDFLGDKSEYEVFTSFFDDDIISFIQSETEKYAHQNNRLDFRLPLYLLKRFLGFLILSGYYPFPREEMFWEMADDAGLLLVRQAFSRNQYRSIKRNIHLADNAQNTNIDKMYKVRQFIEALNSKFQQFGISETHLSIDEQMVPYFGRHSSKMFIRNKPIRFGFKLWCLCSSTGFLYKCIPYCGKSSFLDPNLGLGGSVVAELLSVIPKPEEHEVYFDNFFTSHSLLLHLRALKICATGTVREQRLQKCPLESMKKSERGAHDWAFDPNGQILSVKWKDNANVCLASNFTGIEPIQPVRRFSQSEKKHVNVPQPHIIRTYNQYMGGVDLHDAFVAKYRIKIKAKKWWWPLFTNLIDSAIVNSWRLYRLTHDDQPDLLHFRRVIATTLLKTMKPLDEETKDPIVNQRGRPSSLQIGSKPAVAEGNHTVIKREKRLRCRFCKSQTVYACSACNVGVHPKCFNRYHRSKYL